MADNVFVFEVQYGITDSLETKAFSIWNEIDIKLLLSELALQIIQKLLSGKGWLHVLKSYSKANINSNYYKEYIVFPGVAHELGMGENKVH